MKRVLLSLAILPLLCAPILSAADGEEGSLNTDSSSSSSSSSSRVAAANSKASAAAVAAASAAAHSQEGEPGAPAAAAVSSAALAAALVQASAVPRPLLKKPQLWRVRVGGKDSIDKVEFELRAKSQLDGVKQEIELRYPAIISENYGVYGLINTFVYKNKNPNVQSADFYVNIYNMDAPLIDATIPSNSGALVEVRAATEDQRKAIDAMQTAWLNRARGSITVYDEAKEQAAKKLKDGAAAAAAKKKRDFEDAGNARFDAEEAEMAALSNRFAAISSNYDGLLARTKPKK